MHYLACDTWDLPGLSQTFEEARRVILQEQRPVFVEVRTARLKSHSKGDDTRPQSDIDALWAKDPLQQLRESMLAHDPHYFERIHAEIEHFLALALKPATAPAPTRGAAKAGQATTLGQGSIKSTTATNTWRDLPMPGSEARIGTLLNQVFAELMRQHPHLAFLGEDVLSPYGGAFKLSKGLSDEFPERVRSTPIAEASLIGMGTGLALSGMPPMVEIMFGDFLTLGLDQLLNHATKFRSMFGRDLPVPLVVRTPMGGYRGYGPTHSQSIEKHFMGIPHLDVIALNQRVCPQGLYRTVYDGLVNPTLVIENKVLYTEPLKQAPLAGYRHELNTERYPCLRISPQADTPQLSIVCYGHMLTLVEAALERAFDEHEIIAEVICPTQIAPLHIEPMVASVRRTTRLLTVEEGVLSHGFGSEVIARCAEAGAPISRCRKLGITDIIPASADEELQVLPSVDSILAAILEIMSHE
jgi:2-oxoisovalerate dehydrogenase E1 component